jgi:hypothetical protein
MAMFYGLATMGAGVLLASRQKAAFWSAARSWLALHMVLIGTIIALVGLSERRAKAQYEHAAQNDPDAKDKPQKA